MNLTDYLHPEYVELGIVAQTKDELLERMITIAARNPKVQDIEEVRKAIIGREQIMSTGIGNGCAIPHGKTNAVDDFIIAFGVTAEPVEYMALDNNPVRLVLLIARRESDTKIHLRLLSHASRIFDSEAARNALLAAKTRKEIIDIFRTEEEKLDKPYLKRAAATSAQ
jgi:PTS system fructose-specific IIA component